MCYNKGLTVSRYTSLQIRGSGTSPATILWLAASLTWSCRPGVTVFLVEFINLKPCRGTGQARGRSGGGFAGHMPVIWSRTGSHWLQAWLGVVVQALLFWRCSSKAIMWATDCRRCWPADSTSGLKVFSCCYEVSIRFRTNMDFSLEVC